MYIIADISTVVIYNNHRTLTRRHFVRKCQNTEHYIPLLRTMSLIYLTSNLASILYSIIFCHGSSLSCHMGIRASPLVRCDYPALAQFTATHVLTQYNLSSFLPSFTFVNCPLTATSSYNYAFLSDVGGQGRHGREEEG
jgi:hypothetical protein